MDFQTYYDLTQLYARYASALDAANWEAWPEFFTEDCIYKLQPRENHERGFPLATLAFDSKGMLKDRVYGIRETFLRSDLAAYITQHRARAQAAAAAGQCPPDPSPLDLLADLQRRADERAGELAAVADDARARGAGCERSYDALIN